MVAPRPDAVVFDIGNVLVEWHPEALFDRMIGVDRRRALFAAVDLEGMNTGVDRGTPLQDAVETVANAHPDWADEIRLWHLKWSDMFQPPIDRSVRLLRALRTRGVPVFALSNFGADTFEVAQRTYPFLTEFDRQFISGQHRMLKPEPEFYSALEQESGIAPERLFFTDDRADNISAAEARGWQTHLFTDPEGLAERLVILGFLTPEEAA